tara:strand:- start:32 stop:259 length:228 start_codon:yes stop_codon:yes gene_type:complete
MKKDRGYENNNVVPIANGLRSHMGWAGHKEPININFGGMGIPQVAELCRQANKQRVAKEIAALYDVFVSDLTDDK